MDAITQDKALGPIAAGESARFFVAERFDALECLTARFTDHAYAPHRHETYVVGVIDAGCETWTARGARHYAGPGGFAFNDPEVVHDGAPLDGGYSYRMTYPSLDLVRAVAADVAGYERGDTPSFRDCSVEDPEGAALFYAAHRALETDADRLAAEEAMTRALAHVLVRHARVTARALGAEAGPVARVRALIDENFGEDLTLGTLAVTAGLTPHHLIRAFRKETGLTPHAYLVDRRVRAARDRLKAGERPAEVAAAVGFADQAHLTRAFKARLAVTPGAFRAAFGETRAQTARLPAGARA